LDSVRANIHKTHDFNVTPFLASSYIASNARFHQRKLTLISVRLTLHLF